jgi:hypothetical protein
MDDRPHVSVELALVVVHKDSVLTSATRIYRQEAAHQARVIQLTPGMSATVFDVWAHVAGKKMHRIDLVEARPLLPALIKAIRYEATRLRKGAARTKPIVTCRH